MRSLCHDANRNLVGTRIRSIAYRVAFLWLATWLSVPQAVGDELSKQDINVNNQAVALLRTRCGNCHGVEKQEGGLRVDSREAIMRGGDSGPGLIEDADKWQSSLLWRSVSGADDNLQMPPKNPLTQSELKLLEQWLRQGAKWSDAAMESVATTGDAWHDPQNPVRQRFGTERLNGWSWQPIVRRPLPSFDVTDKLDAPSQLGMPGITLHASSWHHAWSRNSIDVWIASKWQAAGDLPAPELPKRELARRVALDLTGLPPEQSWYEHFLADDAPDAYDRYVDRLLASPRFGQHLARMWLDDVRYSDSNGFDWDEFRRDAWRYRDYVIRSLNNDVPYDRFVREQLAGDLLQREAPRTAEEQDRLLATGYLRMGPHDNAAPLFNEQDRSRAEWMADLTETTASAFLAQTFSCCRCHDHKTDPFLQEDHYRLRAYFAGLEFDDQRSIDLAERHAEIEQANAPVQKQLDELDAKIKELKDSKKSVDERKALEKQRRTLAGELQPYMHAMLVKEKSAEESPKIFVFYQGDHRAPRQPVTAGMPLAKWNGSHASEVAHRGSRLELAEWIAAADNPWTSRVIVNRLWQLLYGQGLVSTGNDFGLTGSLPSHPELLDQLASDFVDGQWSIKRLMRSIVLSSSYRQTALSPMTMMPSSTATSSTETVSTETVSTETVSTETVSTAARRWQSIRTTMRRLSAEQLRDVMLCVSGQLEYRTGGPPVWPELPAEILQANPAFLDDNETKTKGWYPSPEHERYARSIFLIQKRTVRIPLMETFDLPENSLSCACRESSIVAPQALSLLNGDLATSAADSLARLIAREHGDATDAAIYGLFQRCLQRPPNPTELKLSQDFLREHSVRELARALLNTNELMFSP